MKQFKLLRFLGRLALMSGLIVFGVTDADIHAANQKETPLVNLVQR